MTGKIFFITLMMAVAALHGCDYMDALTREDEVINRQVDLEPFSEVVIETSVRLVLKDSTAYGYRVAGQAFVMERLTVDQQGRQVVIGAGGTGFRKKQMATLELYGPSLKRITSNFPAEIVTRDTLHIDHLTMVINGRGAFADSRLILKGNSFSLATYGSNVGNHVLKGEVAMLSVTSEGLTTIDALGLAANRVRFVQRSVNPGYVYAVEELNVQMEASGNVYYRGDAKVEIENIPPPYKVELGEVIRRASP